MNKTEAPGLSYHLPEPDRAHTILRIPGSHTLYVGPLSCCRRHALYAIEFGDKNNVSCLYITEADVVSGHYENLVGDAVEELLIALSPAPHIFFIAVFCIDDFLGTDETAMLSNLHTRFPGRRFVVEHIDPVALNENHIMDKRKYVGMYSFIEPAARHDNGINFLGRFSPLDTDCEFLDLLKSWGGGPVRELYTCKTYEQYQELSKSRLAVVFRFIGESSAKYMRDTLGIPCYIFPASYDANFIAAGYGDIAEMLGQPRGDFSIQAEKAVTDARHTARLLDGLPVAIDNDGFLSPYSTARALMGYGFNIRYIFRSRHFFFTDFEAFQYLSEHCPEVEIIWNDDYSNLHGCPEACECLAIGAYAQRLLKAKYFVDIWHDEGFFGFHGIHRLMSSIREAVKGVSVRDTREGKPWDS